MERRRNELSDFLRSRRTRLTPEAVGLPAGGRRRTAGLRREEVAQLAGIGIDWYVRLEQGRADSPSPATVEALARALKLTAQERAHLRSLALASAARMYRPHPVPDSLRQLIQALNQPAYLLDPLWNVAAWNEAADAIFDFSQHNESDRNILLLMLTAPESRALFGQAWAAEAQRMVAQFRTEYDLHAAAPAFQDFVQRLDEKSAEFRSWWRLHEVGNAGGGHKVLAVSADASSPFVYASFQANQHPELRLVLYAPAMR